MRRNLPLVLIALIVIAVIAAAYAGKATARTEPPPPTSTPKAEGAPASAWIAMEVFADAWQSTDPDMRKAGFAATAIPDLAEGLELTAPENIVTDQRQSMAVIGGSAYAHGFEMTFANNPPVVVTFVADPAAEYGWLATSIDLK